MTVSSIQGMYMNGPMAGRIIDLPSPTPARMTVAVNLIHCAHNKNEKMTMLEYDINKPVSEYMPYLITLSSKFDDVGWYCPTCKAEAEVKFKLDRIKEALGVGGDDE